MNARCKLLDQNLTVVLSHENYEKLKDACYRRGENMSVFGRRAIYAEMTRLGLLPSEGKALLGV